MIIEPATVLQVGGGFVWVRCDAQAACARCAEGRGCGGGVFGRLLGDRLHQVRAVHPGLTLRPGDEVLVGLSEQSLLRAAFLMYLVPVLAMLIAAAVGAAISVDGELVPVLFAAFGLLVSLMALRQFTRRIGASHNWIPVVLRRLGPLGQSPV